jgi:hypothetical protein
VRPVDQSTIAVRVRARLTRPEEYRWADNEFRRHLIRRAGYRVQEKLGGPCVSKHPIWFASDAHGYRDWTCGTDYVEFGLTRRIRRLGGAEAEFMIELADELRPWLDMCKFEVYPASVSMRAVSGLSLHSLELLESLDKVRAWISSWHEREYVPLRLKQEGGYFTTTAEQVNGKDLVSDLWLVRSGTGIKLRMLARRRAGPYQVWQALSGKAGWIEAARRPARTLGVFAKRDEAEGGIACVSCGHPIPESVMSELWDPDHCPRCRDTEAGIVLS